MKAVIIEDEKLASDYLENLLQKDGLNIDVVKIIDNVKDAIQWLSQNTVDIIFLDIHLGDDTSFSIFDKLQINTPIIFTTAYNEYAIKAFKLNSIDYLLKPIDEDELRASIDKWKGRMSDSNAFDIQKLMAIMQHKEDYQERFMVVSGSKIKSILIDQVAYFLSEGRYVKLVTNNNEKYLLDQSLENLEKKLNPHCFYRVNRQAIVSFNSIQQMVIWSKSRVKLELNPVTDFDVIVSIDKSGDFKKWLNR
ncbi:LytR/AlgR family response regulator transcription factor [Mariniflexile sp.]|uniref:LytR/AlgR family response regulator transcription factor n=1 Tax=Mariniflexile sp. TaxID=1979402 RepID=UPI00356B3FE9